MHDGQGQPAQVPGAPLVPGPEQPEALPGRQVGAAQEPVPQAQRQPWFQLQPSTRQQCQQQPASPVPQAHRQSPAQPHDGPAHAAPAQPRPAVRQAHAAEPGAAPEQQGRLSRPQQDAPRSPPPQQRAGTQPALKLVRSQPLEQAAIVDLTDSKDASAEENASAEGMQRQPSSGLPAAAAPHARSTRGQPGADGQPPALAARDNGRPASEQQDIRHLLRPVAPSASPAGGTTPPLGALDVNAPLHQDRKRTLEGHPKGKLCQGPAHGTRPWPPVLGLPDPGRAAAACSGAAAACLGHPALAAASLSGTQQCCQCCPGSICPPINQIATTG